MLTLDDLTAGFAPLGIRDDDNVMVHSSYKALGGVQGGAQTVVRAFDRLVVENSGAVFWPAFTVGSWCGNQYFDHDETPGEVGIIPEVARSTEGSRRTGHPIHSFSIRGDWRHAFNFENIESFSKRGPFGYFHEQDGICVNIGVPWIDTFTFIHFVEQAALAAFRRIKSFAGIYVRTGASNPQAALMVYQMFVRKSQEYITRFEPLFDQYLVPDGVVKQAQVGDALVSWFRCQEFYEAVYPLVINHPELFHQVKRWQPEIQTPGYYPDGEPLEHDPFDWSVWHGEGHA